MTVKTYNSKQVVIALGNHTVSGYAEDSFVTIESKGDGVTSKTGCDGEVVRSVSAEEQYTVKLSVQQTSPTNSFLQKKFELDKRTGDGMFPILIKDLRGGMKFSADACWVTKPASRGYGKDVGNREWALETGPGELVE